MKKASLLSFWYYWSLSVTLQHNIQLTRLVVLLVPNKANNNWQATAGSFVVSVRGAGSSQWELSIETHWPIRGRCFNVSYVSQFSQGSTANVLQTVNAEKHFFLHFARRNAIEINFDIDLRSDLHWQGLEPNVRRISDRPPCFLLIYNIFPFWPGKDKYIKAMRFQYTFSAKTAIDDWVIRLAVMAPGEVMTWVPSWSGKWSGQWGEEAEASNCISCSLPVWVRGPQ